MKCDCQKKNNFFYLIFKEIRGGGFKTFRWQSWQSLPALSLCCALLISVLDFSVLLNCLPSLQPLLEAQPKNLQCTKMTFSNHAFLPIAIEAGTQFFRSLKLNFGYVTKHMISGKLFFNSQQLRSYLKKFSIKCESTFQNQKS